MKPYKLNVIHGRSKLFGSNFGPWPKRELHNFSALGSLRKTFPISLLSCSCEEWHTNVFRERENSDTFSVEFVTEGIFRYEMNGKTYLIHPGECFLVQLNCNCSIHCETVTASKRAILMEGPLLLRTLEYLDMDQLAVLIPPEPEKIREITVEIFRLSLGRTLENYRKCCALCYSLLLEIANQNEALSRPPELQKILEYIHENLEKNISLQDILNHSQCSSATCNRLFRKYLNDSPVQYCLDQKLQMAMTLLRSGTLSIKEIASKLNYSSPQYFASEFKKRFGKTPSQIK